MNEVAEVRPSPIAGTWYSGSPELLSAQVDQYLHDAKLPALKGTVTAIIAPHAGYRYSGKTAGHAFATVLGQTRTLVAVISPMHSPYPANLLTSAHKAYSTPLGTVPVNTDALQALEAALLEDGMQLAAVANDQEHSLEIELPFLQRALSSKFSLLPVMVRSQSPVVARRLGRALASVLRGQNALLVASTDLSHFYPAAMAMQFDTEMLRRMRTFDPDQLFEAEKNGTGYACGVGAAASVLWAAAELGANTVEVLHHSTSGDETGDYGSVVGYGAAVALIQP
jgi:hypothetical protein